MPGRITMWETFKFIIRSQFTTITTPPRRKGRHRA